MGALCAEGALAGAVADPAVAVLVEAEVPPAVSAARQQRGRIGAAGGCARHAASSTLLVDRDVILVLRRRRRASSSDRLRRRTLAAVAAERAADGRGNLVLVACSPVVYVGTSADPSTPAARLSSLQDRVDAVVISATC